MRHLGGDVLALEKALQVACAAVKDRSGDHLCSIAGREAVASTHQARLAGASLGALLAFIAAPAEDWTLRLRAALIAGGWERQGNDRSGREALFAEFIKLGVPAALVEACRIYATKARDPLPAVVPLAWLLRASGASASETLIDLPATALVGGDVPAYALDPLHTRLGRRAVDLWLRSYLMRPRWSAGQVAAALWNSESALCDRLSIWPLGSEIRTRAYRADLAARGVGSLAEGELLAWVEEGAGALQAARGAVWAGHLRCARAAAVTTQPRLFPRLARRRRGRPSPGGTVE